MCSQKGNSGECVPHRTERVAPSPLGYVVDCCNGIKCNGIKPLSPRGHRSATVRRSLLGPSTARRQLRGPLCLVPGGNVDPGSLPSNSKRRRDYPGPFVHDHERRRAELWGRRLVPHRSRLCSLRPVRRGILTRRILVRLNRMEGSAVPSRSWLQLRARRLSGR